MRRSDAEKLEEMIRSLSSNKYWGLVGWLSNGGEGDLWEYLKPFRQKPDESIARRNGG